ncbi:hypothetical protein GCM10027440_47340 [Nocardiopsis coralliicola]
MESVIVAKLRERQAAAAEQSGEWEAAPARGAVPGEWLRRLGAPERSRTSGGRAGGVRSTP